MKKIRINVFETNSSSTHSLVYSGVSESRLNLDTNGNLVVNLDDYADKFLKENRIYSSQEDKLAYVVKFCVYGGGDYNYYRDADESYDLQKLSDILHKHMIFNELIIKNNKEMLFDHQTNPSWNDTLINLWNDNEVLNFIFNDNIKLEVGID